MSASILTRRALFAACLACAGAAVAAPSKSVTVAVAANLKPAFEELAAQFQRLHPDVEVKASYGASGNFLAQIANGAPFDLFLSADADFPAKAVEKGLADGAAFTYAYGKLVVWVPKDSPLDFEAKGLAALSDGSVKKIAIANPAVAPYGRAAKAAMEKAGLTDALKDKLVQGESVGQTAQFAQSGNAQAGFLPLSLCMAPPLSEQGRAWAVPADSYQRIEQAGVVVKGAKSAALARALVELIKSDAGREVLQRLGYDLPEK